MTADEACEAIRGLAAANRYDISQHARARMNQRGVRRSDLHKALCNTYRTEQQDAGNKWKATGPDMDNDDLDVVVVLDGDMFVVTVF